MAKPLKGAKCDKCNLEFPESTASEDHKNKAFVWHNQILCEDCLIMEGGEPGNSPSWWDFRKDQDPDKPADL